MANDKAFKVKNTLELAGYNTSIASTAVDVFVYDTSKDSDGGAWRKRTQHTSWYNETLNTATRGSRREFPAVAVIVAESSKVTIYDGDDPALPMWMVFNVLITYSQSMITAGNPPSTLALSFLNGLMVVGSQNGSAGNTGVNGLFRVDFISDTGRKTNAAIDKLFRAGIDKRNTTGFVNYLTDPDISSARLAGTNINDVAMTVLPNAPIDPATGLPVPTIAVATASGVSVITDSGAVYDSASTLGFNNVRFDPQGGVYATRNNYSASLLYSTQADYTAGDGFGDAISNSISMMAGATNKNQLRVADVIFLGNGPNTSLPSRPGLMYHLANSSAPVGSFAKGMTCFTTSTYNTGWMNGDIKGAFLSSTDTASLVGSTVENSEFTGTGVTDGWILDATATNNNGVNQLDVTTGSTSNVVANKTITGLTAGAWYKVRMTRVSTGKNSAVFAGGYGSAYGTTGVAEFTFQASATTQALQIRSGGASENIIIDNVSVKLADADRSVNNNGLIVNGTVTRSAVATGAELVAYSGFSSSNYLEQPYNSDLDFGTGDFCVMGWVKPVDAGSDFIASRAYYVSSAYSGPLLSFLLYTGKPQMRISDGTTTSLYTAANALPVGVWSYLVFLRYSGNVSVYANGVLVASGSDTKNIINSSANLTVGRELADTSGLYVMGGSLALWRISATAPTAEQIKKIYEDEKVLFQDNAACTLYGTSDAVTALAHDSDTGLLHVGTSAGRSVFQGLRRVSNTTTAVGTAISASNGLVVEE